MAEVNGPMRVVISGMETGVEALEGELGMKGQTLRVSHVFHSPLIWSVEQAFREVVESVPLSANGVTTASAVTSGMATAEELMDVVHWVKQVVSPVLFMQALETALGATSAVMVSAMVEVGPNPALTRMATSWIRPQQAVM